MARLARGQSSSCTSPALDLYTSVAGKLTDVAVLGFQVFDISTPAKRSSPVQVYPASRRKSVDVSQDCPAGDRLSRGHYVARWIVPDAEPLGSHEVRWFFKLTASSTEHTFVEELEVVAASASQTSGGYCSVADLRAEGITAKQVSDTRLQALLQEAGRTIERITGWFFEPRSMTLRLDGRGTPTIEPPYPPIKLDKLQVGGTDISMAAADLLVVGAPVQPDFDAPRLTRVRGTFPKGRGNVTAQGTWGYTEPDGTATGCTPAEIRRACMLLALRSLPGIGDTDAAHDAKSRWRLIQERTRDQSYKLDRVGAAGPFTGDPEIDGILLRYRRPAGLGAT